MKIIVGLGNPGLRYRRTRHNLGFMVVGRLAEQRGLRFRRGRFKCTQAESEIGKEQVLLVRPMTFMNLSGVCVASVARQHGCEGSQLLVVCDDVNLELGKLRLRRSGSAGGHKGLESIIQQLHDQQFPRLRLGIGQPSAGMEMMRYVLSPFRREEWPAASEMIERAAQAAETWVYYGLDEAMNRFNAPSR
jgi:PTH1 family peptidyl-tRNA hydrolase